MTRGREVRRNVALAALLAAPVLLAYVMIEPTTPPASAPSAAALTVAKPIAAAVDAVVDADDASPPAETVPSPAPAFEFVKPDEVAIEGIVVAPAGEPVAGALVLVQTEVSWPMPRTVRACTGADGRFRVAAPPDKRVVLRFVTPKSPRCGFRHPVGRVEVAAGGTKELIVRLSVGETISGRVVDGDGNGVAGLLLRTRTPPAMSSGAYVAAESATAQDGSFAFDGLPAGFATIEEERPDGSVAEHVLTDAVQVRTGSTALLVRRLAVVEVAGRVTEADGRPAAKRTVVLARRGAALTVEARTDAAGRFRADVATPGKYVVRLRFATQSGHTDRDMGEIDASVPGEHAFVAPAARD